MSSSLPVESPALVFWKPVPRCLLTLVCLLVFSGALSAASMSDPAADAYNVRVGTQTFAGLYKFTTNTLLVETGEAVRDMGSGVLKFYMGSDFAGKYGITLAPAVNSLTTLARDEPSCHRVLDLPFQHYIMWAYCFSSGWWADGFSAQERQNEYNEIYALARYLLTNYNNSGKSFYLGHWEGDWHLLEGYDTSKNPTAVALQGMRDWLNTRQQAVDDARRNTPHSGVEVYLYTEANRVLDAINNGATNNQRVINQVVPYVTNLDYVSWSSYDGQNLSASALSNTLDYMQSMLPTNKASISGRRIFVGEYGWGGSLPTSSQEPPTRAYIQKLVQWGCPFILFWEIYNNEPGNSFALIDQNNARTPCYDLHWRFANLGRLAVAEFKQDQGRLPTSQEFQTLAVPWLSAPLPPPVNLALANGAVHHISADSTMVDGSLLQGVYGDEWARVSVFWGTSDAGTSKPLWEHVTDLGTNAHFGVASFTATLNGLINGTTYYFRFYATNLSGEAWAPSSATFFTRAKTEAGDFASRLRIQFAGYNRAETLAGFPALIILGTNLAGFGYSQFASPSGGDLRFSDASGMTLFHEIDEWNTNGSSSIWVQVPTLAGTNDGIWAWWGNPSATNPPVWTTNGATWLPSHELVWHLKQAGLPYADSVQRHPATTGIAPVPTSSGLIGRAQVFNGNTAFLDGGAISLGNGFTLSAWVRVDTNASNIQTIWSSKNGGYQQDGLALYLNSYQTRDQKLVLETGNGIGGISASTAAGLTAPGQWHYIAAAVNRTGGTARLYIDGADRTQSSAIVNDFGNSRDLNLGRFPDGNYHFLGVLDEVRIAPQTCSSNWIWATWMTVASNSTFASYATVEHFPRLNLTVLSNQFTLTWPGWASNYTLWCATNLPPPSGWSQVTSPAAPVNGAWTVQFPLQPTNGARFYRLQGP